MSEQNIKLFCIPGGGASAFVYWKYTKYLNKNIKLCLLELPGRGLRKREEPVNELHAVVDDLYAHLVEELNKTPGCGYMLLGYCYGGILAYELYQKIRREGIQEPFHIFMSATDAADGAVYGRSLFENQEAREEVQDLMTTYFPDHVFPDKELVTEISNRCVDCLYAQYAQRGEIGMIPYEDIFNEDAKGSRLEQISRENRFEVEKCLEFACETIRVVEADLHAVYAYKQETEVYPKIYCDLTIFSGKTDLMTPLEAVKGWIRFAEANFHLYSMEGGHRMLLDAYQQCMPVINYAASQWQPKEGGKSE